MILAFVEHERGRLADESLEALTLARRATSASEDQLQAVMIGEPANGGAGSREALGTLGAFGVGTVHVASGERLSEYAPLAWARAVAQACERSGAGVVVAPGTERGNEVMAHVAAILELPMAANCTEVRGGDPLEVTRLRWGGSLLEEALLDGTPKLVTVAPHAVAAEPAGSEHGDAAILSFEPSLTDSDVVVRVTGREQPPAGRISLGEARVVVGGGRGMGGADGFKPLEELADLLGGAVGCSRAVTSAGWRPHSDQIGQTGARIAPELYIACGISGAIQHIVGCKAAKRILAINIDPEAPILAQADYAILGDARQVVSALVAELRASGA